MNWPPNKAWTSTTSRLGFRHFVAINYGGKGSDRWVNLVSVLDGQARLRVSWQEMKDSSMWNSGWQQLPKLEAKTPDGQIVNQQIDQNTQAASLHPSEDFDNRPWFDQENS